jgi:hypothetical protein
VEKCGERKRENKGEKEEMSEFFLLSAPAQKKEYFGTVFGA